MTMKAKVMEFDTAVVDADRQTTLSLHLFFNDAPETETVLVR